ncbi:MAG: DUF5615 family PIN-like protein [Nanoarchaeota archaeon]|mgnify:CR=1 FL=1
MLRLIKSKILSTDQYLSSNGFDVQKVPLGSNDDDILKIAKQEKRAILTFDRHFINTRLFSPKDHFGIIFLNIHPPIIETINTSLNKLFMKISESELKGKLFILSSIGFRIRE